MFLDCKHAHMVVSATWLTACGEKYRSLVLPSTTKSVHFHQFYGQINLLAFMPAEDVPVGMQLLKARCPDETAPPARVLQPNLCFWYMWSDKMKLSARLAKSEPFVHSSKISSRTLEHTLSYHEWLSQNQQPMWRLGHNKLFHFVGYQDPSIWKLIRIIQKEEAVVSAVIARDSVGEPTRKKIKKIYADLQHTLKNLCKGCTGGRKNLDQVLWGLSHNMWF